MDSEPYQLELDVWNSSNVARDPVAVIHNAGSASAAEEAPTRPEIPYSVHRRNFWVAGTEAAIFITAADMMGPMTVIPFLLNQTGIDKAWIGLFAISNLFWAIGGPLGLALVGDRARRLPFCLKVGFFQRLPFLLIPLGVTFFFAYPVPLLILLVFAFASSNFVGGIGAPIYQTLITYGTRERWWGRMMSLRNVLAATGSLGATGFIWWVNRAFVAPHNYALIGWLGVAMLFISLYIVSRYREIPMPAPTTAQRSSSALREIKSVLADDRRALWLVIAQFWRAFGFLTGTYMTAVLIDRCRLTDTEMWIPILLATLPAIFGNMASGWLVDHWGAKPALVLSSFLVTVNALIIVHCYSIPAFVFSFVSGYFGGSLLQNAWPTIIMKLAPAERRPAYFSTISLATAPGNAAVLVAGIFLVRAYGYDTVFYISSAGSLIATILFYLKLPHIRQAPN